MAQPPTPLDPAFVTLVGVIAVFAASLVGAFLTRLGSRKSEDAKRLDTIIKGLEDENDRKRKDIDELKKELVEAKAEIKQLEALNRQAFMAEVHRIFPDLPPELPGANP